MYSNKVFIHVGLQKTALTFLQTQLFPRLQKVAYFGRPYTQDNHAFNLLQFADNSLYDSDYVREEIKRLELAAGGKQILLSDELFSGFIFYNFINRTLIAERLSELFPNAEIIIFLRGQVELIMSLYNQYVKIGWFDQELDGSFLHRPGQGSSLEDWLARTKAATKPVRYIEKRSWFIPEHFRYSNLVSLYKETFSKVHIFLYEDLKYDSHSTLERLATLLSSNIDTDLALSIISVNPSLSERDLDIKRTQNRLTHIFPGSQSKYVEMFLRGLLAFRETKGSSEREWVISSLTDSKVFSDNIELNNKEGLGMEKYPEEYFYPTHN